MKHKFKPGDQVICLKVEHVSKDAKLDEEYYKPWIGAVCTIVSLLSRKTEYFDYTVRCDNSNVDNFRELRVFEHNIIKADSVNQNDINTIVDIIKI